MGIIRGGSVFILCILLFLSFILMDSFFILGSSLKYDHVQNGISTLLQNISSGSLIPNALTGNFNLTQAAIGISFQLKIYCQNVSHTEYTFAYQDYNITLPCTADVVNNPQAIINKTFTDFSYQVYYKNYDCGFFDCFSKTGFPFFLISEKAMNYWLNKFYIMLAVSLALIFLIFLFIEQKQNTPILVGAMLILTAFPILKLKDLIDFFAGSFAPVINIFLSGTKTVFTISLVIGVILIALGIVLRILGRHTIKKSFQSMT